MVRCRKIRRPQGLRDGGAGSLVGDYVPRSPGLGIGVAEFLEDIVQEAVGVRQRRLHARVAFLKSS